MVIDEAHRFVYAKYGQLFEYFDGLLVGLTATPKDEIDHNTYWLFHLEDGVPTDAYPLDEAVADGYLVPFEQVPVTTKFQDSGIHYDELSEDEREAWDLAEWGEKGPPEAVASGDLGRLLCNEDTVDKVLEQLMTHGLKVADGDRLGKTIIFAANQRHAEFIEQRFNAGWPEHAGRFARVITHSVNYAQSLIDDIPVREGRTQESITQRLVEHRVALVAELDRQGIDHPVRGEASEAIRAFLREMHLVNLIVDELTAGGVMEPGRLFESPYTDRATIDYLFPEERIELLFATLAEVRGNAVATAS